MTDVPMTVPLRPYVPPCPSHADNSPGCPAGSEPGLCHRVEPFYRTRNTDLTEKVPSGLGIQDRRPNLAYVDTWSWKSAIRVGAPSFNVAYKSMSSEILRLRIDTFGSGRRHCHDSGTLSYSYLYE